MPFTPAWTNTGELDAQALRRIDAMMVMSDGTPRGVRPGIRPGSGALGTTLAGTTFTVATGTATISGPTGEGVYRISNPAEWTGTLTAAHASLDRIDLVYARVWDTDLDGTGLRQADIVYLPGTPSATPSAPPIPAGLYAIPLATITVPHSGGGTPSVSTAVRPVTVAPGGILPVTSTADIAAVGRYVGQYRDNTTTGAIERWSGSAWVQVGGISPAGTASGTYAGQYRDSVTGRPDRWNGSAWVNGVMIARKAADQSITNSMTYVNATDLVVPLEPNASYAFEAFIVYSTTAAADIKFQWTIPSGATLLWSPWSVNDASVSTDTGPIRTVVGNSGFATLLGLGSSTNVSARPIGTVNTGGTAGNLQFQFAQNSLDTLPSNIRAGSWLKVERIS